MRIGRAYHDACERRGGREYWRVLLSLLLLPACPAPSSPDAEDSAGDGGLDGPTGDPLTIPLAGECPLETHFGSFVVEAYQDYAYVDGALADGVVPATVLAAVSSEGDCTLWKRNNPYCEPTCASGYTCDFEGECVPYPVETDLGTVTVYGLTADVVMEPVSPGYGYFFTTLSFPGFREGELVELATSGGAIEPFTLHGVGPALLEPAGPWSVQGGSPLAVQWNAPVTTVRTEVRLSLTIDQHGQTPLTLVCHFPDSGSAEVPASVVDALVSAGVTGYPTGFLRRQTADSVQANGGCVDLLVDHDVKVEVTVTGHTPCDSNDDCPPGETCNLAIETCE
jgi:hypothetical protein